MKPLRVYPGSHASGKAAAQVGVVLKLKQAGVDTGELFSSRDFATGLSPNKTTDGEPAKRLWERLEPSVGQVQVTTDSEAAKRLRQRHELIAIWPKSPSTW